jgi:hypothetical protein
MAQKDGKRENQSNFTSAFNRALGLVSSGLGRRGAESPPGEHLPTFPEMWVIVSQYWGMGGDCDKVNL